METAVEATPEVLTQEFLTMAQKEIKVVTAEDRIAVGDDLSANKTYQKKVKEYFGPLKKQAKAVHSDVCSKERALLDPAILLEAKQKDACITYEAAQERLRMIEQARLEAEARKQEEEARKAGEAALMEEAAAAEKAGNTEEAEAILEEAEAVESEPVYTPPVIAPKIAPKVEGQSYSVTYKAEVVSLPGLFKAIADGRAPQMAGLANQVFLNQQARSLKDTMNIPGVKLVKVKGMAVRGR